MNYKDVLIKLASMTIPYVYDDEVSFLELDRKLYKIVHELIIAMQGLNSNYEEFKTDMTNSFNSFTATINNNFDGFKTDVNNQISTFEENMNTNFNSFKTEIEGNFNTLQGEFNTLKDYVDNYFANLNLDEEVSAVIQKMYSDGTLADIINEQIFNDLNTKIDNLEEQVENIITNCGTGGLNQLGAFYYVYSQNFGIPVDKQLYTIQMPELTEDNYIVYFYNRNQTSAYTGWKLNNVKALDVSNQLLLVQASITGSELSFNVVGMLPSKEIIADKISDLLVTNCGTGGLNQLGAFYYVYSQNFGIPVDKQLYTIQMPELTEDNYIVYFYNRNQTSAYTGWKLNNVKALDVSNQLLLVQASVVDNTLSFNIVGILASKEIIADKISDLLVTNCGTGGLNQLSTTYYVYSQNFGMPADKQLFTIQMPELPLSDNIVYFYNKNQTSAYTGWKLNNVKALDVSNQLLLVQASVVDNTLSFNIIAGKNIKTITNLEEVWEPSPIINSTIGQVSNQCLSNKYIGNNQYKLSGFFSINNTGGNTTGNITIKPLLSPTPIGTPAKGLFVLKFDGASQNIEPIFIDWTGEAFVLNNATITQNESVHYFIVPQVIKFE